jgi:hypothetical protein
LGESERGQLDVKNDYPGLMLHPPDEEQADYEPDEHTEQEVS